MGHRLNQLAEPEARQLAPSEGVDTSATILEAPRRHAKEIVFFFAGCMLYKSDGCHTRALEALDFLVSKDFKITVYSFSNHSQWPWTPTMVDAFRAAYPSVNLVCESLTRAHQASISAKNLLFRFVPFLPTWVTQTSLPFISPAWRQIYRRREEVTFWVNYADGVTQLNGIGGERVLIDTHDLLFVGRAQRNGWAPRSPAALRYMRKELSLLARARWILSISAVEQAFLFTMLGGESEVTYLPPRLAITRTMPGRCYEADLLFLGSDNAKNIRYLNQFLAEFVKWRIQPSLIVAGRVSKYVSPSFLTEERITVRGYVSDLAALYGKVRAVVCPVEGSGVNMKIIEAINHCKPVFASEVARSALSPEARARTFPLTESAVGELLDDPEKFAERYSRLNESAAAGENNEAWNLLADRLNDL